MLSLLSVAACGAAPLASTLSERATPRAPHQTPAPGLTSEPTIANAEKTGGTTDRPDRATEEPPRPEALASSASPASVPSRAWLGITMKASEGGVIVETVWRGSPAAASGILVGDRVLRVGETAVSEPADVIAWVSARAPGERMGVQLLRDQEYRLVPVTLETKPDPEDLLRRLFVGTQAPSLASLRVVQGSVVPSPEMLRGKVHVVEFWASWCAACRALSPTLNEWAQDLAVLGVEFLGVTMDPFDQAAAASRQLGLLYPTLVDESGEVTRAYQGSALPTLFVIDRAGIIRDVIVGYNPVTFPKTYALLKALALPEASPKAASAQDSTTGK